MEKKDYQDALFVQSACNLVAVIHSFDRIISRIADEARANGHGTEWVNKHPICRLFAEQISFLAGNDTESFMVAFDTAEKVIESGNE